MKVYRAQLRADFYVLAENDREAEEVAKVFCDFDEIEACIRQGSPYIDVYCTPNQDDELKRRAVNYDDNYHAVGKDGESHG